MSRGTKIYTLSFGVIYLAAFATVVFAYQLPFADLLTTFLLVGVMSIAILLFEYIFSGGQTSRHIGICTKEEFIKLIQLQ